LVEEALAEAVEGAEAVAASPAAAVDSAAAEHRDRGDTVSLINTDDQRRIEAAIKAAEAKSGTELVVAVVKRSGEYWVQPMLAAVAWALAAAIAVLHFRRELDPLWAVGVEIVVGALALGLFRQRGVLHRLIPGGLAQHNVEQRALALFAERGVHRTRDRTGMLLLVSELERRVVILGDTGIHERVGDEGWRSHVDHIVSAIRGGDAATGIVQVIERLGAVHAELVPRRPDDVNELPDDLIRD
jgi:putative membrane protein